MITEALKDFVRVNTTTKTIEIYDEYGVKLVLKDLDEDTYNEFKKTFTNY